ncbi:GGDEF domain-containing protein [Sphingomonas elodea]|uniref:GGDEF domain-containing protein n=1 Tax=Sphingomonas elodea TaxID=179878 RepID=UPI001300C6D8
MGDALLHAVGARLSANVRPEDVVARIGGDEFLIVLRNMHPDAVGQVTDRLIRSVAEEPFVFDGQSVTVGMSIGYACYPEDAADLDLLRLRADAALYTVTSGPAKALRCVTITPGRYQPSADPRPGLLLVEPYARGTWQLVRAHGSRWRRNQAAPTRTLSTEISPSHPR